MSGMEYVTTRRRCGDTSAPIPPEGKGWRLIRSEPLPEPNGTLSFWEREKILDRDMTSGWEWRVNISKKPVPPPGEGWRLTDQNEVSLGNGYYQFFWERYRGEL